MNSSDEGRDGALRIVYNISFKDGTDKRFNVNLDPDTLDFLPAKTPQPQEWTRLDFHKCVNCTLDPAVNEHCPCAVNLMELMEFLGGLVSHESVCVLVETNNRNYLNETSLQDVASSLIGIVMATSGCPILDKLRPMVETHLPFASVEESTYRYVTMYLFAQYFLHKNGKEPDWGLEGLVKLFDEIEQVNIGFCDRLDQVRTKDASVNAVTILSSLSAMARLVISGDGMAHWESIIMSRFG